MSFVKVCPGKYDNTDALEKEFHYCAQKCEYWSGYGIRTYSIAHAIFDMIQIKKLAEKEDGKPLYHMVISIWRYYVKPVYKNKAVTEDACCDLIGNDISQILYNMGYQNAYFKHNNNGNRHLHFIINSVNFISGNKLSGVKSICSQTTQYLQREYPFLQWEGPYYV